MVPIKSITKKSTSDKFVYQNSSTEPGPCTKTLGNLLDDIYKGKIEDKFGWLVKVEEPNVKTNGTCQVNDQTH
jgi:branched-chain amino acid aminotransferase